MIYDLHYSKINCCLSSHSPLAPFIIAEHVKLRGEGKYNLNAVKEIKVTESYLALDMKDKGCQDVEPLEECTSRHYIDMLLNQCGCLPLRTIISKKVHTSILFKQSINTFSFRTPCVLQKNFNVLTI